MKSSYIIFIFLLVVGQLHHPVTTLAQHSVQLVLIEMNVVAQLLRRGPFCFLKILEFEFFRFYVEVIGILFSFN